MTASTSRSLAFSVLLHAGVIAVALLLMIPANREQVIIPQTFVIFPGPAQSATTHEPSTSATHGPAVTFPTVTVPVSHPAPVVVETADEPAPRVHASPVPARRVLPPVVPSVQERVSPRMTSAEFQRQHPSLTKPAGVGPQVTAPRAKIDLGSVLAQADESLASVRSAVVDENLSGAYLSRLLAKLRAAHGKPTGLDAGLQTRVEFSIRADGTLADVRILESSGNREFDASVLAAFLKVGDLGAPPFGPSKANHVTFKTNEGG